jgi:hypothetical protein
MEQADLLVQGENLRAAEPEGIGYRGRRRGNFQDEGDGGRGAYMRETIHAGNVPSANENGQIIRRAVQVIPSDSGVRSSDFPPAG